MLRISREGIDSSSRGGGEFADSGQFSSSLIGQSPAADNLLGLVEL